jgi:hypothetical protein
MRPADPLCLRPLTAGAFLRAAMAFRPRTLAKRFESLKFVPTEHLLRPAMTMLPMGGIAGSARRFDHHYSGPVHRPIGP